MLTSPLNSFSHTAPAPEKITDAIYTHTTRIGQYKLANIPEVRTPTTSHFATKCAQTELSLHHRPRAPP